MDEKVKRAELGTKRFSWCSGQHKEIPSFFLTQHCQFIKLKQCFFFISFKILGSLTDPNVFYSDGGFSLESRSIYVIQC